MFLRLDSRFLPAVSRARRRLSLAVSFRLLIPVVPVGCLLAAPGIARADVIGRLHFIVTSRADKTPVAKATITLHDATGVRPDITLTTEADGTVTSPPLENHAWHITVNSVQYQIEERDITVAADTTTDVEFTLGAIQTGTTTIRVARNLVKTDKTSNSTTRSGSFFQTYPVTAGNDQSLSKALLTNPGFVQDSSNQAHPRGEHSSTSIYINQNPGGVR